MVAQNHVTHERLLQILTTGESMGFEHIGNAPIKALSLKTPVARMNAGDMG